MIPESKVRELIKDGLEERAFYVTALNISSANEIYLEIDAIKGVTVKDCIDFSRMIEHQLDREIEDFKLSVSSPGLSNPFKVFNQYRKYVGEDVEVLTSDAKFVGKLEEAVEDAYIKISWETKEKIPGRKKKEKVLHQKQIAFGDIKETKVVVKFK